MSKAINDSLNLTISISFLVKIILAVGVFAGGFYSGQMRITDLERTVSELHTEVTVLNQRFGNLYARFLVVFGVWTVIAFITGIGW